MHWLSVKLKFASLFMMFINSWLPSSFWPFYLSRYEASNFFFKNWNSLNNSLFPSSILFCSTMWSVIRSMWLRCLNSKSLIKEKMGKDKSFKYLNNLNTNCNIMMLDLSLLDKLAVSWGLWVCSCWNIFEVLGPYFLRLPCSRLIGCWMSENCLDVSS